LQNFQVGNLQAFGAHRDQLLRLMLFNGLRHALCVLGLGLLLNVAATRIFLLALSRTRLPSPRGVS
jgi:ABC-type lipoprotein release transport system permease subunit